MQKSYKTDSFEKLHRVEINQLSINDLEEIINQFTNASVRAKKSGFDGIQIHTAHGFFLSRFLSPIYNSRTDVYGGSTLNRGRIILEIIKSIKKSINEEFVITIKINSDDFTYGGLTMKDSLDICRAISKEGIDAIEISGNFTSRTNIKKIDDEGYFKKFAIELKKYVNTPIILVGGHKSIENMENLLNHEKIEYFSLSRPLIKEPNLIARWFRGDIRPATCISCNNCYETYAHKCIFNK